MLLLVSVVSKFWMVSTLAGSRFESLRGTRTRYISPPPEYRTLTPSTRAGVRISWASFRRSAPSSVALTFFCRRSLSSLIVLPPRPTTDFTSPCPTSNTTKSPAPTARLNEIAFSPRFFRENSYNTREASTSSWVILPSFSLFPQPWHSMPLFRQTLQMGARVDSPIQYRTKK